MSISKDERRCITSIVGLCVCVKGNQPTAQTAARHNIFPQLAPYLSGIVTFLVENQPGASRLGGEIGRH